jgi:hypothetical protein
MKNIPINTIEEIKKLPLHIFRENNIAYKNFYRYLSFEDYKITFSNFPIKHKHYYSYIKIEKENKCSFVVYRKFDEILCHLFDNTSFLIEDSIEQIKNNRLSEIQYYTSKKINNESSLLSIEYNKIFNNLILKPIKDFNHLLICLKPLINKN